MDIVIFENNNFDDRIMEEQKVQTVGSKNVAHFSDERHVSITSTRELSFCH